MLQPGESAAPGPPSAAYRRREPEKTLLHEVVREHLGTFLAEARDRPDGRGLPYFVERELSAYLDCGVLTRGFIRVRCEDCGDDRLVAFSCKSRTTCPSCSTRRMHDTAAFLVDSVLPRAPYRQWVMSFPKWLRLRLAIDAELASRVLTLGLRAIFGWQRRKARKLGVRRPQTGSRKVMALLRARDEETEQPSDETLALTSTYEPALQPSLPRLGARADAHLRPRARRHRCSDIEGFSLHADVVVAARDRKRLEYLCRYGLRPPLSLERLSRLPSGDLAYRMKRPGPDGARDRIMTPLELVGAMAALVPPPRVHLARYHGVFAANSKDRVSIVRSVRDRRTAENRESAMSPGRRLAWADLLKRVFALDVLRCDRCRGRRRVLAAITDPVTIRAILTHLGLPATAPRIARARPPPQATFGLDADPGARFDPCVDPEPSDL